MVSSFESSLNQFINPIPVLLFPVISRNITNYIEQSPSSEAYSYTASQEIPYML
jgi:hypothetical protein